MKSILAIIVTTSLSFLLQCYFPWWSLVVAAAAAGAAFPVKRFQSFMNGFLGTGIVWWAFAWYLDVRNEALLSTRVAEIFQISSSSLLILLCGLIAATTGGFAALTGLEARKSI